MKKTKHSEEKIIAAVKQMEAGRPTKEVARELGVTDQTLYNWKSKYGGMEVSDAKRLRTLEEENRRLKEMVADLSLDKEALKTVIRKNGWPFGIPSIGRQCIAIQKAITFVAPRQGISREFFRQLVLRICREFHQHGLFEKQTAVIVRAPCKFRIGFGDRDALADFKEDNAVQRAQSEVLKCPVYAEVLEYCDGFG